jgi:hypothetical protein
MKTGLWSSLFVVLVVLGAGAAALIAAYRYTNSEFLLGVLGVAVAIITASVQYRAAKDKETQAHLFAQKQQVYTDLIETLMGLFHEKKSNPSPVEQGVLVKKLQQIRTKLLVWGSASTIQALDKMGEIPSATEHTAATGTMWMSQLFTAIRKDLGHRDPPNAGDEIAIGMLIPADRETMRKALAKARSRRTV